MEERRQQRHVAHDLGHLAGIWHVAGRVWGLCLHGVHGLEYKHFGKANYSYFREVTVSGYADAMSDTLERMDRLGFERGGEGADLANHGPMAADALATLGYTGEVAGWVERYKTAIAHHELPARRIGIDRTDEQSWRGAMGQFGRAGDWEHLFRTELADTPWRSVLARWWPRLLPGLLAGLTHGLIRTAHAVRSAASVDEPNDLQLNELSRGLAYWAARYTPLPGQPEFIGSDTVAQAIAKLPRPQPEGRGPFKQQAQRRIAQLDELPAFRDALTSLAPGGAQWLLSEMSATFAGIYLAHPEVPPVPLVHGVTAPAAIRLVLPHLPDALHARSVEAMWQISVTFLLVFTRDRGAEQHPLAGLSDELPTVSDLLGRALEHGDEHVIKFTEACVREAALRPDPRYLAAALQAMNRIPAHDERTDITVLFSRSKEKRSAASGGAGATTRRTDEHHER
jgi:hypothetical protein